FRLQNKQPQGQQDEEHSRDVDGEKLHRVEGQHGTDTADDPRRNHARVGELRVEAEHTDNQKHEKDIGFDDAREEFLPAGQFEGSARSVRQGKFRLTAIETRNLAAIELSYEVVDPGGDEVDHLAVQGLFVGERFGFGDRGLRQRWVAPALFRVTAQEG